jgi:hypothetical protein
LSLCISAISSFAKPFDRFCCILGNTDSTVVPRRLQHDPDRPRDILKTNINDAGVGGDDTADALRYLVATRSARIIARKLTGL